MMANDEAEMDKEQQQQQQLDVRQRYCQGTFEAMTQSVRQRTVWVNRLGMESLLPELKMRFHDDFLQYLRLQHNIKTRYAEVVVLETTKEEMAAATREKPVVSDLYAHTVQRL